MASYFFVLSFYVLLMVCAKFVYNYYSSKKNAHLLSNMPKVNITGKETVNSILEYSRTFKD